MPERISKRGALRFAGHGIPIRYKTEFDDGQAALVDISTSGCAIEQSTVKLEPREKVLLVVPLGSHDDEVEIKAKVVRVEGDGAGLQFQRVSEVNKHRILHFFAQEKRRRAREEQGNR